MEKNVEYWVNLSIEDKLKILSENEFWDGFSRYKYEYLPDDLKLILKQIMADF